MANRRSEEASRDYVMRLNQMVKDAKEAVDPHHLEFDRSWKFYHGDHTEGLEIDEDQKADWLTVNVILSNTETRIPVLLDAAPTWFVASPDDENEAASDQLEKALQAKAQEQSLLRKYEMVLRDQIVIGNGCLKAWWDPTAGPKKARLEGPYGREKYVVEPIGDIALDWQDPYSVFPDPAARSLEECEYLALSSDVAGDRAKRLYPDFDEKKAEPISFDDDTRGGMGFLGAVNAWMRTRFTSGSSATGGTRQMYRIWEMYHDGGAKLTVFSGTNILFDGDNPMPNNRFPIVMFRLYPTGYDFWSQSETLQVAELQQSIDRDLYRISAHARATSDTPWVIKGAPNTKIESGPGAIIYLPSPESSAERIAPPSLPNYVFNLVNLKLELLDKVTGVHDVNRGLRPGGVQSGIGIQQVLETALTRLRNISRSNADQLGALGQLVLEMMQGLYGEDRTMTYMDGHQPSRVTIGPGMLNREIQDPTMEDGAIDPFGSTVEAATVSEPVEYRVVVQSGGDLPLNAMAKAELAARAAQTPADDGRPMIGRPAYLEAIQFPGRKEILARMQQSAMAQMEGQATAMQAQGMLPGQGVPQGAPMEQAGAMGQPGAAEAQMAQEPMGEPMPEQPVDPQQIVALLEQVFSPEEIAMVQQIIAAIEGGQPETPEMIAFLEGLTLEQVAVLEQVLSMIGLQPPPDLAADAAGGPMGLV